MCGGDGGGGGGGCSRRLLSWRQVPDGPGVADIWTGEEMGREKTNSGKEIAIVVLRFYAKNRNHEIIRDDNVVEIALRIIAIALRALTTGEARGLIYCFPHRCPTL